MEKKYKVGYTTGVFDLFHIGHLNLIRNAKELCEYLIVGVSTDECAYEYKRKKPIIPFSERFEILKAIRFVDQVVPQTTMNKMDAWRNLKFNVLFHGDDWKNTALYENYENEFKEIGVQVVYLPHTKGTSSTEVSKKIYEFME